MLEGVLRFAEAGGLVGLLLWGLGLYLWTTLALRAFALARGDDRPVAEAMARPSAAEGALCRAVRAALACTPGDHRALLHTLGAARRRLPMFRRTIRTLSATAPMLGLLGTVSGMIQTFDALGAAGGRDEVAAGISQALLTTELGLALAIPGLLIGRLLEGREAALAKDIDELEAQVIARWGTP